MSSGFEERQIPVAKISLMQGGQPRQSFAQQPFAELTASMDKDGQLQAILVKPAPTHAEDGAYELIAGERRLRAASKLGWETIRAAVAPAEADSFLLAIAENLKRADLDPIEQGLAFTRLMDERGWNKTEVTRQLGVDIRHVMEYTELLALPPKYRDKVASGEMPVSQGLALVRNLKDQAEMDAALEEARSSTGGAIPVTAKRLSSAIAARARRKWLEAEKSVSSADLAQIEFLRSLLPVSTRLLGLLQQLAGGDIPPEEFRTLWSKVSAADRKTLLKTLRAINLLTGNLARLIATSSSEAQASSAGRAQ